MNRHASMNRAYRLIWSAARGIWIPVAEKTHGRGKQASRTLLAAAMSLGASVALAGGPSGGQVTAGTGSISQSGAVTTITQDSAKLSLSWASFNVASQQTVDFLQPSSSAIAVNRISDTNGSQILGHLNANGQVFLINPNGILFGPGAQVNVGGLVASTLDLSPAGLDANARLFSGTSNASVVNEGTISAAPGGYVALVGSHVSNQGVISAQLGTVALVAGSAATLTFSDNSLLQVQVNQNVWRSAAQNGGLIRADGGQVIMTAGARDALLASVVNNTGVIEARTVGTDQGRITLLAGMAAGTVEVGGTLDASAPHGGNGGFIETSAAHVEVSSDAKVTTAAAMGLYGSWLIDPQDFTIAATGGDMTGAALSTALAGSAVVVESSNGLTPGSGNINVDDAVAWGANTVLTLTAANNVNINANITATGNTAGLVINPATTNGADAANINGVYTLLGGASITLSGATPSLSISSHAYTVINSLGAAGSTSGTDLQGINGGLAGYYALGSNLDASATSGWNASAGFTPIGNPGSGFSGTFDGLGHTISNLTISLPANQYVGLFGHVNSGGVVENVGLIAASVVGGPYCVGGLVGRNYGTVSNSYMTGSVTGTSNSIGGLVGLNEGSVSNSHATATVFGPDNTGGLIGANDGTISNSYATGAVSGQYDIGGLVGVSTGNGNNVYATGSASGIANIGGLVGLSHGAFSNSYATGSAHGSGASIGGLVGNNYGTVNVSYATGAVSGGSNLGGLVGNGGGTVSNSYWDKTTSGRTTSDGGTGLTTTQMQTIGNFGGFFFTPTPDLGGNDWVMVDVDGGLNNAAGALGATFPMLASEYSTIVTNAHQLQLMAMSVSTNYTLGQNIDASATALAVTSGSSDIWSTAGGFIPIGSSHDEVTGNFDGAGYSISDLTMDWPAALYGGLFTVSVGAIQNVGLVGGSVTAINVGALIGLSYGSITNSYASANVSGSGKTGGLVGASAGQIANSYATGNVTGGTYTGGLVGRNGGSISGSHATGNVSGTNNVGGLVGYGLYGSILNSYASGIITGTNDVGGLVGSLGNGGISSSYATGSVTGTGSFVGGLVGNNATPSGMDGSYATGVVTGDSNVGGLVGGNYGQITNSYATGAVTGTGSSIGGMVGLNSGGRIFGSHATGAVTGASAVGGLVGYNYNGLIFASYASGNVSGGDRVGGLVGQNYGTVYQNSLYGSVQNSYATGVVTATTNAGGLVGFNNDNGTISNSYATGSISGGAYVGGLVGTNSGTISNSYATGTVSAGAGNNVGGLVGSDGGSIDSSYATGAVSGGNYVGGLVGQAATQGVLPISNSYATGAVTGGTDVGGLVGYNAFAVSNSYATGAVTGTSDVGGLVGYNASDGTVGTSYATGSAHGSDMVGGLSGYNYGTISNSYATGSVVATAQPASTGALVGYNYGIVSNSYATGSVVGGGHPGGLVGDNEGSVTGSFWNTDINAIGIGNGTMTGAAGLTTAGMMTMSNFSAAGWSISDTGGSGSVWRIYEGNTAPLLLSFMTPLTVTVGDVTQTYSGAPVANLPGFSYSVAGAATSGHLFNLNDPYGGATNVGSYTPALYSDQLGYDISYFGALTITPATLTVTAGAVGKVYGQANPALAGSVTGFVGSDTLANATTGTETFTTAATLDSGVGSYAISASGLIANNGNYQFSYAAGNAAAFQVTPATLTYNAAAASFGTGQTPTGLSGTLSGFVLADSQANATAGTLTWTTSASAASAPGRYAIDGGGLTATNYVFVEATANATALTVQAGTSPAVLGADAAALGQAQTAAGTLEADLPAWQTNITLALLDLTPDIAQESVADAGQAATSELIASDGIMLDKRVVTDAMIPSLRIVRGGVKLPADLVDVNAP
jgi:filamentous hemagglutinin family protein